MSSVHHLREFISARLTAAAEEIFSEFEKTIVQYEEEMDRHRRLLDISWKPHVKLHRADEPSSPDSSQSCGPHVKLNPSGQASGVPQQHVCKEEESPADQEIYNQEDIPHGEEEEEGEQLTLKQECDMVLIPINLLSHDTDPLYLRHSSVDKSQDQEINEHFEASRDEELKPKRRHQRESDEDCPVSPGHIDSDASVKSFQPRQKIRGEASISHKRTQNVAHVHSSERCVTLDLKNARTRMDERPFPCPTCGKNFRTQGNLMVHRRVHTGERTYCRTCGKGFTQRGNLLRHMRTHTGERPFTCGTCGKKFSQGSHLFAHMRIHTGEKPYDCGTCGKGFSRRGSLMSHMKVHIRSSKLFIHSNSNN